MNNQIITALLLFINVLLTYETIRQLSNPNRLTYMAISGVIWVLFYFIAVGGL